MSNADTFRKAVAEYNLAEGDWNAIKSYYHDDFRVTPVDVPESLTFDEMAAMYEGVKTMVKVDDLVEYGDDLIARLQVTISANGGSTSSELIQWVSYQDGLIVGAKGYANTPTRTKEFLDSLA
jgi:hypothetical protein